MLQPQNIRRNGHAVGRHKSRLIEVHSLACRAEGLL